MRSDYKHYQNRGQPGDRIFVTTTVLDFVEVFKDPYLAELAAQQLFDAHSSTGAALHAFVVMSRHLHFLTTLPPNHNGSQFMRLFKSMSARSILPLVSADVRHGFDAQKGLNQRQFWKLGFRSYVILRNEEFYQKLRYIHLNPVRAGICELPHEHRWSSARLIENERWFREEGINYEEWSRYAPKAVRSRPSTVSS